VRSLLRANGHDVFTPSLTGAGERSHLLSRDVTLALHVEDILRLLRYEDLRDVVLVGHSYGGMVITAVADQAPERLARLVYLDAAYPVNGQNAAGGFAEGTGDRLETLSSTGPEDLSWLLPPLPLAAYGVTDPADIAWIGDRRVSHPLATLHEPIALRGAVSLPRTYIRCTRRQGLIDLFGADPLLPMYERAVADGLTIVDIDAGHDAMVTAPREVADALIDVSRDAA
jgi:pimeloyl-ACP methyl ester carboxylesterase